MQSAVDQRRLVPLQGAQNVRDLGGYPTRSGRTTRWGRLFRGDGLDDLTFDDVAELRSLGIATIYDLRTAEEREHAPDVLPSMHVPLVGSFGDDGYEMHRLTGRDEAVDFLTSVLVHVLDNSASRIGSIVFSLADATNTPVLWHCTAGKDRAGLLSAVVLEMIGVPRDVVLDDFELSATYLHPDRIQAALQRFADHGVPPEAAAGLLGAPRHVMCEVLGVLDDRYGGADRYLSELGGVDREALDVIRSRLTG